MYPQVDIYQDSRGAPQIPPWLLLPPYPVPEAAPQYVAGQTVTGISIGSILIGVLIGVWISQAGLIKIGR